MIPDCSGGRGGGGVVEVVTTGSGFHHAEDVEVLWAASLYAVEMRRKLWELD